MYYNEEEIGYLRDNRASLSISELASKLGRTVNSVRTKLWRMGLVDTSDNWTVKQIEALRKLYSSPGLIDVKTFANSIGKDTSNVSRKAHLLGFPTSYSRPKKHKPIEELSPAYRKKIEHNKRTPEEQKGYISRVRREVIREHGHPRGRRDMRTCPLCGKFFEVPNSSPQIYCSNDCALRGIVRPQNTYTRGKGGKRSDLNNQYFRSRYEANYARYLNFLIRNDSGIEKWEYEADTFWFDKTKRGVRSYTPDFKIYLTKGSIEYHEVKGWDYPRGKTARKRMAKYHPLVKLILIDEEFFKAFRRQGIDKLIEGWEYDHSKVR